MEEVVRPGEPEFLNLVFFDHAGDAQDAHIFERGVGAHPMAHFFAVDVGQHHVEDDQVGMVLFDHHARVEAVLSDAHFEAAVLFEHFADELDQFGIVVHHEHFAFAAL